MIKIISLTIFCLYLTFSNSLPADISELSLNSRIVGGRNASISEFPFIARVFYNTRPYCGSVIVNEHTLISAAHCYYGNNHTLYTILAGQTDVRNNGSALRVGEIIIHPEYYTFYYDDIAILKLAESLPPWNAYIQPVRLPPAGYEPKPGTILDVSGWGDLYYGAGAQSYFLQTVHLTAISNEVCAYNWTNINPGNICGLGEIGHNSCNGDSGGPLSVGPIVLGLVSYGSQCASAYPKVFTRVSNYLGFINEHL